MRKILTYGLLIIGTVLILSGCDSSSQKSIKEISHGWLHERNQKEIINLESAKVTTINFDEEHMVATATDKPLNIQNKNTYQVTFETNNEILGPIVVYLEKDTLEVLGVDYRD